MSSTFFRGVLINGYTGNKMPLNLSISLIMPIEIDQTFKVTRAYNVGKCGRNKRR